MKVMDVKGMYGSALKDAIDRCCELNDINDLSAYQILDKAGIDYTKHESHNGLHYVIVDGEKMSCAYNICMVALQELGMMSLTN